MVDQPANLSQPYQFQPRSLAVKCGTKVTATNNSSASHTWQADNGRWNSGNLDAGQRFSFTMRSVGTFSFLCQYHSYMTGSIKVTS